MTETYEREYYTEVYRIILSYGNEYINKIPKELFNNIKSKINESYEFKYNPQNSFKEQNVKKEAVALLVAIKMKYWCESNEEKTRIQQKLMENTQKHEEEKREKYSYENLFKNNSIKEYDNQKIDNNETTEETQKLELQIYQENAIIRLAKRIKQYFINIFKRR